MVFLTKRETLVTFFGVDEKNANTCQERNGRHIYQLVLCSKSCFRLKLCCPTFGCWLDVRKAENFASDKSGGSGGCRWNENCCKCSSNQTFSEKNIFNKLYTLKELFIDWGNLCNQKYQAQGFTRSKLKNLFYLRSSIVKALDHFTEPWLQHHPNI